MEEPNVAFYYNKYYRCKKSWLTQGYSNKEYLDEQSTSLPKELKAALYGIHKRDGNVVTEPSRIDLDFLSAKYSKPLYYTVISM